MGHNMFNREATTWRELVDSRSSRFIQMETRAAKGHLADPPLNAEERRIVKEYVDLTRSLGPFDLEESQPF